MDPNAMETCTRCDGEIEDGDAVVLIMRHDGYTDQKDHPYIVRRLETQHLHHYLDHGHHHNDLTGSIGG